MAFLYTLSSSYNVIESDFVYQILEIFEIPKTKIGFPFEIESDCALKNLYGRPASSWKSPKTRLFWTPHQNLYRNSLPVLKVVLKKNAPEKS